MMRASAAAAAAAPMQGSGTRRRRSRSSTGAALVTRRAADASNAAAAAAAPSPPAPPPAAAAAPRIEFPPSTVVSKADGYDLRLYQPYPVVRTEYEARPPAFLSLGEYLGGANATKTRFARPEPAIMRQGGGGAGAKGGGGNGGGRGTATASAKKTMELFIGSRRDGSADDGGGPPTPDDPSLALDVSGGELVAVATFGGNLTREAAEGAHAALRAALARDGLGAADGEGEYRACQYGAIHSLGERRNEIWVKVKL